MKSKIFPTALVISLTVVMFNACNEGSVLKPQGQGVLQLPSNALNYITEFEQITNRIGTTNGQNPRITNDGATLGRVLFYDASLSLNNAISCASCHHQNKGFSDGQAFSVGFEGKITPRNSMAIINAVTNNNLFWDSRSNSAFDLALKPVQNHIEMGMEDMSMLKSKLASLEYYPALFDKAYGSPEITEKNIADALAQFLCSIGSTNSKFDKGIRDGFLEFTPKEKLGKELFFSAKTNCSACHNGSNFSAPDFPGSSYGTPEVKGTANIGLDIVYKDQGKGNGKFRIPSLRNIALTGPYMHDGRFATLSDVVNHYNSGIANHPDLDENLKSGGKAARMNLNNFEKDALIAFLETLTDYDMTQNSKFSNPFIH
jgi:cytochrome c peroxidase